MHDIVLVFLATVFLAVLLRYEHNEDRRGVLAAKTVLSLLFVLVAIVQPHPKSGYYHRLLPGLLFCLGGDVWLTPTFAFSRNPDIFKPEQYTKRLRRLGAAILYAVSERGFRKA